MVSLPRRMLQRIPRLIFVSAPRASRTTPAVLQYRAIHSTPIHSKIMGIADIAEKVIGKAAVEAVTGQTPVAAAPAETQLGYAISR